MIISKKATMALVNICIGNAHLVTRQMMDRLNADKLVDFEPWNGGWNLTELGYDVMLQATDTN